MQLDNLMVQGDIVDYYKPSLRYTLEALIPTYRTSSRTSVQTLPANYGLVYNADLFGALQALNIKPCYHWFIMRLNNFFAATEFNSDVKQLLIPNFSDLESDRTTWQTTQGIAT